MFKNWIGRLFVKFYTTDAEFAQQFEQFTAQQFEKAAQKDTKRHAGFLRKMFKRIVGEDLTIAEKIINVKKGKLRYRLLIIATPEGKLRYNLGRHKSINEPKPTN